MRKCNIDIKFRQFVIDEDYRINDCRAKSYKMHFADVPDNASRPGGGVGNSGSYLIPSGASARRNGVIVEEASAVRNGAL